jgi:hypothetical protein
MRVRNRTWHDDKRGESLRIGDDARIDFTGGALPSATTAISCAPVARPLGASWLLSRVGSAFADTPRNACATRVFENLKKIVNDAAFEARVCVELREG